MTNNSDPQANSDPRALRMEQLLQKAIPITYLSIKNLSHLHRGHNGDDGSGQTHYEVCLGSPRLAGMTRVDRHRYVMGVLGTEFESGLHALQLKLEA